MNSQPSSAMVKGLTAQFTNSVMPMPAFCSLTSCIEPKSIFISIGMIITQISRPTGMLTWAISSPPSAWKRRGTTGRAAMPATMQRTTQRRQVALEKADARGRLDPALMLSSGRRQNSTR
jgi:hypothetical protein